MGQGLSGSSKPIIAGKSTAGNQRKFMQIQYSDHTGFSEKCRHLAEAEFSLNRDIRTF